MVLRDQTAVESRSHGRVVLMMMMWKWISESSGMSKMFISVGAV